MAVAVSRVGAKDLAVDLPNLEFDTLDACAGILIRFDDLDATGSKYGCFFKYWYLRSKYSFFGKIELSVNSSLNPYAH